MMPVQSNIKVLFKPGTVVIVRNASPPGHFRVPKYIRGKIGRIDRPCGSFANPEELAYGRCGLSPQPLYRVVFLQTDLWLDYDGSPADTLEIDLYQHWLEKRGVP